MLRGHIDHIQRDLIEGWAVDTDTPQAQVELSIAVDGAEVGRVVAERNRGDLARLGIYGDGRHGFAFRLPEPLSHDEEHDVVVQSAADHAVLAKFKVCRRSDGVAAEDRESGALRYVIHIGQPKTGTKYLQHFFHGFQAQLLQQEILYPMEWWQDSAIFNHDELHKQLRSVPNESVEGIFRSLNESPNRIVLLSCEGFSDLPVVSLQYLRYLIAGNGVDIVYYARRWSDLIRSTWQQNVKEGASETLPAFYARTLARAADSQVVNQKLVLDRFAEVFGHGSLNIVSYSNMQDHDQDIAANFFQRILGWKGDLILDQSLVHESMDILMTELVRCLNALEVKRKGSSNYRIFTALEELEGEPGLRGDIECVFAAMRQCVAEISIDDNAYGLRGVFDAMQGAYGDRLINREFGETFFERKSRLASHVSQDFLLTEGVAAAIGRIHAAVVRRAEAP